VNISPTLDVCSVLIAETDNRSMKVPVMLTDSFREIHLGHPAELALSRTQLGSAGWLRAGACTLHSPICPAGHQWMSSRPVESSRIRWTLSRFSGCPVNVQWNPVVSSLATKLSSQGPVDSSLATGHPVDFERKIFVNGQFCS
jgi:hypothetical protein